MLALFLRDVGRLARRAPKRSRWARATSGSSSGWPIALAASSPPTSMGPVVLPQREALASMLTEPRAHAPFPYREDRLEVRYMDGRELAFPDASFDVVFSVSSIEHFGGPRDIARAARELGRVLRPGGHAVIITECFVQPASGWQLRRSISRCAWLRSGGYAGRRRRAGARESTC